MTLTLFNSLTRQLEEFKPIHDGEAKVYTCGPTVYNYPHVGNMRAYVFADTLGRALEFAGYKLTHVINITDVGHLTSDADAGDDKMERAASAAGKSAWEIAEFYKQAYWADVKALNIREPAHWSIATDYVPAMIEYAKGIADTHCYQLESGLYFDTSTVADYGRLARTVTADGANEAGARIDAVEGKRHAADFAIWRNTPAGETRQMEWDSPWGRGAPGWHLECSVMSAALLGLPFDIHTGGIDHREIHHPNEIAQNQAHSGSGGLDCADHSGARIWMHNNFLIDRTGKMSKSSGEFLRLQLLIDKGFHPLGYRLLCLQAHYRSELEFSWEGLDAALTRLKRLVIAAERNELLGGEPYADQLVPLDEVDELSDGFMRSISDDLNTPLALTIVEKAMTLSIPTSYRRQLIRYMDAVLGLQLTTLTRADLRMRPANAVLTETDIEAKLDARKAARASRDFATSDRIRDELVAQGVEVMDGDPLGWDWKLDI